MALGADMYRQRILDHCRNPRNHGELAEPTYTHVGENTSCGDRIAVDVKLDDAGETVEDIAWRGESCVISQAAASLLTDEVRGMTLSELYGLDRDDALDLLDVEVTPMRIKCAVLAEKVIQDGARIYEGEIDVDTTTTE